MPFSAQAIDEIIIGCVMPDASEANIARQISLRIGCNNKTPAWTVQRNCASGLQAIDSGMNSIKSGRANLVMVGGTEVMSRASLLWNNLMVNWLAKGFRLTDPLAGLSMEQTAENLALRFNISRSQMDHYALQSHQRLAKEISLGELDNEITPLYDQENHYYDQDNGVRKNSSLEKLAKLLGNQ